MTTIDNLIIAGVGLSSVGGIVYGSYELLKDVPQPVTKLLEIKSRVPLDKSGDSEAWAQNWQKYKEANTIEEEVEIEATPSGTGTTPIKRKVTQQKIKEEDIWGLSNWKSEKDKAEAPLTFKEKCEEKFRDEHNGIWTKSYKEFESFCTKEKPAED